MQISRLAKFITLLLVVFAIGCHHDKKQDAAEILPVDKLYTEAKSALTDGNLTKAVKYYKRLIARFPFGPYTEQSELDLAYAQYKSHKPEDAYSTINRFIKTYPTHKHVDYAYYLRGIINFDRDTSILESYARQDMSQRDQGNMHQSFEDFSELLTKFPDSRYAQDARQRMVYLRDNIANSELNVAKYYLRHDAYVAAANRAKHIVENYQRTPQAGDALAIMVLAYKALNQEKLAADSERVLKLNYPDHPYFQGNWPPQPHFWRRLVPFEG